MTETIWRNLCQRGTVEQSKKLASDIAIGFDVAASGAWTRSTHVNRPIVSPPSAVTPDRPPQADTRLRGRWLVLARTLWLAVAALSLSLFAAGVAADFARLQVPCP